MLFLRIFSIAQKKVSPIVKIGASLFLVIMIASLLLPNLLLAQQDELNKAADVAGIKSETDLAVIVGRIIRAVLGFLGLNAVIFIFIGGFMWMTSQGDEDKIKKAKNIIKNGVIGLFIIVLAYTIASFVIARLQFIVGTGGGGATQP